MLSSTAEQRFSNAHGWEEGLISIEAIVNAFMFLYGQLVIEFDVNGACRRSIPSFGASNFAETPLACRYQQKYEQGRQLQ